MARAFVSIGSNIEPAENVKEALHLLGRQVDIRAVSTVYRTEPIGPQGQPSYYNCVIEIETELPPRELKHRVLRRIEEALGRRRSGDNYAARTIDLDLILYDELVLTTDDLTLPDPDIVRRPFLAIPLHELEPGLVVPGSGSSIDEAASRLSRRGMKPLKSYTERIRKDILHERKQ
ncbi:MAG: 2-amino-4-hydroxy-6-hydroxymethyldihydropteridine diphosphokinase [Betaproteobacteria bacterium]